MLGVYVTIVISAFLLIINASMNVSVKTEAQRESALEYITDSITFSTASVADPGFSGFHHRWDVNQFVDKFSHTLYKNEKYWVQEADAAWHILCTLRILNVIRYVFTDHINYVVRVNVMLSQVFVYSQRGGDPLSDWPIPTRGDHILPPRRDDHTSPPWTGWPYASPSPTPS